MREYITFKKAGREVKAGYIDYKKQSYISHRNHSHQFHKFGEGFGCSVVILNYLREKGIETILIIFEGSILKSSVQDFYDFGERYHDGEDKQLILPLEKFEEIKKRIIEKQETLPA